MNWDNVSTKVRTTFGVPYKGFYQRVYEAYRPPLAYPKEVLRSMTIDDLHPKPVRATNLYGSFVLNRQGVLQGPFTFEEWQTYAVSLLDEFGQIVENPTLPLDWRDVFFRYTGDFYAGSYSHFVDIWLILINQLPGDDLLKHWSYYNVFFGVDITKMTDKVSREKARDYHGKLKVFTVKRPHGLHRSILAKVHPEDWEYFATLYSPDKNVPRDLDCPNGPLVLEPSKKNLDHVGFINDNFKAWIENGAIIDGGTSSQVQPELAVGITVANPEEKPRECWDGSILKEVEHPVKLPCKLDRMDKMYPLLKKNCWLAKCDDKSGYHQMRLSKTSETLLYLPFL